MVLFALLFAAGVGAFHQLPRLPDPQWWLAEAALIVVMLALGVRRGRRQGRGLLFALAALPLGFGWSHLVATISAPATLAMPSGRLEVTVVGTVRGLPDHSGALTRFVFETHDTLPAAQPAGRPLRFRLSWRDAPRLAPGEVWTLTVRLKAARGYAAPGAWDYERWLYDQGIRYTGYVRDEPPARRLGDAACCPIDRWRQAISNRLADLPLSDFSGAVLRALVVADRSGLDEAAYERFQATGTSHLMAVSGLHIGLASGGVMLLVGWAWRRIPALCSRVPVRIVAAAAGLVAAAAYAALAGFGLPTQRALIMLLVFAGAVVMRRRAASAHALGLAALAVLMWHPASILDAGFWLSFGAVATIFATLQWTSGRPLWLAALAIQMTLTVALWPVLLAAGLPASGISPLVNLLLVPVFGFVIVPWSLAAGLLAGLAPALAETLLGPLVGPLGWLLDIVAIALDHAAQWSRPLPGVGSGALWLLIAAVVVLMSPPGFPLRWAAIPLLALPWLPRQPVVAPGDFRLHLLDVGQGLSAVIETHRHVLVFDTGPAYPSGFSTADAVVLPFLAHRGHRTLDHLMISHGDSDHGGGLAVMQRDIPIARLSGGEPAQTAPDIAACAAGQHWEWDGVRFSVLHPERPSTERGNDASCVLHVENPAGAVLLTGDIEARVERRLVAHDAAALQAEVVVAPHHGSRSSSTVPFIEAVAADHVLFAAGWANRYGFPDRAVVARWAALGASVHETAQAGTLSFRFAGDGTLSGPRRYRLETRRIWSARDD